VADSIATLRHELSFALIFRRGRCPRCRGRRGSQYLWHS